MYQNSQNNYKTNFNFQNYEWLGITRGKKTV